MTDEQRFIDDLYAAGWRALSDAHHEKIRGIFSKWCNQNPKPPVEGDAKRVQWDEFHACFIGDCEHGTANDCIPELRKAAKDSDSRVTFDCEELLAMANSTTPYTADAFRCGIREAAVRSRPTAALREVLATNAALCRENYEVRMLYGNLQDRAQGLVYALKYYDDIDRTRCLGPKPSRAAEAIRAYEEAQNGG